MDKVIENYFLKKMFIYLDHDTAGIDFIDYTATLSNNGYARVDRNSAFDTRSNQRLIGA